MKELLYAGRALLSDLASTLLFFALYGLTGNLILSVVSGLLLVAGQIGRQLTQRRPVDTLQWISLVVVIAAAAGTLQSRNPLYVMLQPSAIYLLVGTAMLKRGWMQRYLPAISMETVPDMAILFGYVWAGLMFFSAALNLVIALNASVLSWGAFMSAWGTASKIALFLMQYGVMKTIGRRRRTRARLVTA
jgi:intracellular septation protein